KHPAHLENAMFSLFRGRRRACSNHRARPRLEALEDRTTPARFLVNTLSDAIDPRDGLLSLREAIQAVNVGDLGSLSPSEQAQVDLTHALVGDNDTVKFEVAGEVRLNQSLTLSRDVTIQGPVGTNLVISGQDKVRVFKVDAGVTAALRDLNITGGQAENRGGFAAWPGYPADSTGGRAYDLGFAYALSGHSADSSYLGGC